MGKEDKHSINKAGEKWEQILKSEAQYFSNSSDDEGFKSKHPVHILKPSNNREITIDTNWTYFTSGAFPSSDLTHIDTIPVHVVAECEKIGVVGEDEASVCLSFPLRNANSSTALNDPYIAYVRTESKQFDSIAGKNYSRNHHVTTLDSGPKGLSSTNTVNSTCPPCPNTKRRIKILHCRCRNNTNLDIQRRSQDQHRESRPADPISRHCNSNHYTHQESFKNDSYHPPMEQYQRAPVVHNNATQTDAPKMQDKVICANLEDDNLMFLQQREGSTIRRWVCKPAPRDAKGECCFCSDAVPVYCSDRHLSGVELCHCPKHIHSVGDTPGIRCTCHKIRGPTYDHRTRNSEKHLVDVRRSRKASRSKEHIAPREETMIQERASNARTHTPLWRTDRKRTMNDLFRRLSTNRSTIRSRETRGPDLTLDNTPHSRGNILQNVKEKAFRQKKFDRKLKDVFPKIVFKNKSPKGKTMLTKEYPKHIPIYFSSSSNFHGTQPLVTEDSSVKNALYCIHNTQERVTKVSKSAGNHSRPQNSIQKIVENTVSVGVGDNLEESELSLNTQVKGNELIDIVPKAFLKNNIPLKLQRQDLSSPKGNLEIVIGKGMTINVKADTSTYHFPKNYSDSQHASKFFPSKINKSESKFGIKKIKLKNSRKSIYVLVKRKNKL